MNFVEKVGDQSIVLYQLFFIYNYMIFKNKYSLIMFIIIFISIIINALTKYQLIHFMKRFNHKLPLLGSFCRPNDVKCENLTILGYGMPSGHSQIASFIPAIYYFLFKDYEDFSISKFITLISIGLFIMTTRYTSKKHSIQQILMGSLYGILIAYLMSFPIKYIL